jgi:hypothetical protein
MMPGRSSFGPLMQNNAGMGQMMGAAGQQKGLGGLLSKILGRGSQGAAGAQGSLQGIAPTARALGGAGAAASNSGGILQSLTNPSSINGFLTNTQKVLSTAQQFGPMVQQYGPIVKNIPSMWKMYRSLKNLPDAADDEEESSSESTPVESAENNKPAAKKGIQQRRKKTEDSALVTPKPSPSKGQSLPKLYV